MRREREREKQRLSDLNYSLSSLLELLGRRTKYAAALLARCSRRREAKHFLNVLQQKRVLPVSWNREKSEKLSL